MVIKRALRMLLLLVISWFFAACVSAFDPDIFMFRLSATPVLFAFSLALIIYFSDHVIDPVIRRYLISIAGFISVWILLRGAKYIAFEETDIIARHIWYLYYIPALFIPFLSLKAALSVGEENQHKLHRGVLGAGLITFILAIAVLTNDQHQLVFRFNPNFAGWDTDYSRSFVFYIIYIWIALLFLGTVCILSFKCRVSASRKLIWIPALPAVWGICYLILYSLDLWPRINGNLLGEFPEALCFTMAGIWLSLMHIGLIPSNDGYGRLFEISGLSAQIADRGYHIIYKSPAAMELSLQELKSEEDIHVDANTRIHRKQVHGGFVYWQDDISELNRICDELRETGERLSEEKELYRLQNELKEKQSRIAAKTKNYDEIAEKVAGESRKIDEICRYTEQHPESYVTQMKKLCILAAYIKRFANLTLLAADCDSFDSTELYLAIQESLKYVGETGIPTECVLMASRNITAGSASKIYSLFEQLLEQAFPMLKGLQISLNGDVLKCLFEGASIILPSESTATLTIEDGSSFVSIPLEEAGETV